MQQSFLESATNNTASSHIFLNVCLEARLPQLIFEAGSICIGCSAMVKAWGTWYEAAQQRAHHRAQLQHAMAMWSNIALRKAWSAWHAMLARRSVNKQALLQAIAFLTHRKLASAWRTWQVSITPFFLTPFLFFIICFSRQTFGTLQHSLNVRCLHTACLGTSLPML